MKTTIMPLTPVSVRLFSAVAGARFVTLTEANPFHCVWICEGDVSSDRGTEPPIILALSPENDTVFAADTISLTSNVSVCLLIYFKKRGRC